MLSLSGRVWRLDAGTGSADVFDGHLRLEGHALCLLLIDPSG
jgi:hypothetical protein